MYFFPQLLQVSLGDDPLHAGLHLLPWTGMFILVAPAAGNVADRIGERPLLITGLLLQAVGAGWLALIADPDLSYAAMITPLVVSGVGVSLAIPAAQNAVFGSLPPDQMGKASGANSMLRELGGVFGIAVVVAVFAGAGSYASPSAFTDGFGPAIGSVGGAGTRGRAVALTMPSRVRVAELVPAV